MTGSVIFVHILLAILLFFIVNWIGRHSITAGYLQLSLFSRADEAPAFNFLFRVLAPVVYLILVAALFYAIDLDIFVTEIYLAAVYYVIFRLLFNVILERGPLLNWSSQAVVGIATCSPAYFTDRHLISKRETLLPDFGTVSNELWIIVLIFLYQTANNVTLSSEGTDRRKRRYLTTRYQNFQRRYHGVIAAEAPDSPQIQRVAFAVLIYETFNRPAVYRAIESYVLFPLRLSKSLGPMQVQTDRHLSDEESVRLGTRKLYTTFLELGGPGIDIDSPDGWLVMNEILKRYNVRSDYPTEVSLIFSELSAVDRQPARIGTG